MVKSQDLLETINVGVKTVSWKSLEQYNNMLVIGKNGFYDKIEDIKKVNKDTNMYVVLPSEIKYGGDLYTDGKCEKVEWKGRYTLELVTMLADRGLLERIDCFIFWGVRAIDLRNINLLEIAKKLKEVAGIQTYCINSEGDLYYYENVRLCYHGLELYVALDEYVEACGKE